MLDFKYEDEAKSNGYTLICGIDEAGRGPLMGPVCAAAVILPPHFEIEGLNDSKKLTEKKREVLFPIITSSAVAYGIAYATEKEIDELNILNATMLAMNRAIKALSVKADFALIDGNCSRSIEIPSKTIVGGDAKCPSISAASILAKVSHDRLCYELDKKYPEYGFAKHKGYGTKEHMEALKKFGPCPCHRMTFLKFLNNDDK
ncbi:MAG: ribonuclease HII [Clostridia bacterium]|nr:ribonuclease HII [Clostridia bacterium]